ncbi:glycosyltransferase family 4 protein [Glaciecola sp. 33A]|jgi:glycosyltransferase involved in cell wall biosynthesis|uniref:glycosyltransferase family 4 protein n=1 Tax=Glaciecola sp. 33A TaxID=2057807 RepID=UPI000C341764|nr:glycosyltransferase family 4 protein [Glaciecola sp. 33A]PKI02283.1 glycosyltransferase family 1 protein [Glaciecola sp. 33A]
MSANSLVFLVIWEVMIKKVLFVLNADWYFNLHWKERAVDAMRNGFDVHVAIPSCEPKIRKELSELRIVIHIFSMHRTSLGVFSEVRTMLSLLKVIKLVSPQVVHSVTIKPNLYCSFICRLYKLRLVTTYAGLGTLKVSNILKYRIARKLIFGLIKLFSKNLQSYALFENEEDLLFFNVNNLIDPSRLVRVFGAGVNLETYSYSPPLNKIEGLEILFASRLLKDKGLLVLVDAVKHLKSLNFNIKLNVAGIFDPDSPLSFSVEEIEKMSLANDITWLGQRDDIALLIAQSDLVALPTSYGEGVPRILIEACAIGRPILTTPLGGCKDICIENSNGFLVKPNNVTEIVDVLKILYSKVELITSYGLNGRHLVESKFSNASVFEQNISIYKKLLD